LANAIFKSVHHGLRAKNCMLAHESMDASAVSVFCQDIKWTRTRYDRTLFYHLSFVELYKYNVLKLLAAFNQLQRWM